MTIRTNQEKKMIDIVKILIYKYSIYNRMGELSLDFILSRDDVVCSK